MTMSQISVIVVMTAVALYGYRVNHCTFHDDQGKIPREQTDWKCASLISALYIMLIFPHHRDDTLEHFFQNHIISLVDT